MELLDWLDRLDEERQGRVEAYFMGGTYEKNNPYLVVKEKDSPMRKVDNTIKTVDGFKPPYY